MKISTNKFIKGNFAAILSLLIILAIICLFIFITIPLYNNIIELKDNIHNQRIQLAIFEQQIDNIEQTRQAYNSIKSDTANIEKVFVQPDQFLNLIDALEIIAINNNITQNIGLDSTAQPSPGLPFNMKLTANGGWQDIIAYLAELESMNYYLTINDINLSGNSQNVNIAFSLTIHIK